MKNNQNQSELFTIKHNNHQLLLDSLS